MRSCRKVDSVLKSVLHTYCASQKVWKKNPPIPTSDFSPPFPNLYLSGSTSLEPIGFGRSRSFSGNNRKTLNIQCLKVLFPSLSSPVSCRWVTVLPKPPPLYPIWNWYYRLPVPKRVRDLQWRIAHWVLPTNSLIHRFSQTKSEQCPFCGQTETLPHAYIRCNRLTLLFVFLKMLLACLSSHFDFPTFIFGPSLPFNSPTAILIHFFLSQAKLAIYKTRKSKMCYDLYPTDSLEVFKALCVSRIKLEFWCCSQVQVFETQWCVNNAFCKVSEGQLKFTY